MHLESLLYVSQARRGVAEGGMDRILERARTNNARDGITGALLVYGHRFMQLLEGEAGKLRACFARIQADPRHEQVCVLEHGPIDARMFGPWAMRHVELGQAHDPTVSGFLTRLGAGAGPGDITLAKALLQRLAGPAPAGPG